jgi:hypothetical protein
LLKKKGCVSLEFFDSRPVLDNETHVPVLCIRAIHNIFIYYSVFADHLAAESEFAFSIGYMVQVVEKLLNVLILFFVLYKKENPINYFYMLIKILAFIGLITVMSMSEVCVANRVDLHV